MQQQERHVEFTIIGDCLVEGLLGQGDGLRLALDEKEGLQRGVIDYRVAANKPTLVPSLKGREMKSHFNGNERSGIAELLHHAVQQLLSNPLFRRQPHPSVPPVAEDLLFAVVETGSHLR
jgi:hypothetical protein